ncbi:MAG TPA: hypothetical protein VMW52_04485, partial [Phycisphaerae bacterium]|nr:hypothetical protein [Phycisphaerae bacterium]
RLIGTVPGVVPLAVAGLAGPGPGAGHLRAGEDGSSLAWRAPGSATFGPLAPVALDGDYLLEDGEDADKWLRVRVYVDDLPDGAAEAEVLIQDRYANGLGHDDVTAAEAAAGDQADWTLTLENVSAVRLERVVAWLVNTVAIEISADDVTYRRPTLEVEALGLGAVEPAGSIPLYVRRTVAAGAGPQPRLLNRLRLAFNGL